MDILRCVLGLFCLISVGASRATELPQGFVNLTDLAPSIAVEMRYASDWNFTGRVVPGYHANKCFLSRPAAEALAKVQEELQKKGYSLLVFDCYRPQQSVDEFARWSKDPTDLKMQKVFYQEEPKATLFKRGYIASKSGHSRGSTVDVTLIRLPNKNEAPANFKRSFHEEPGDCRFPQNIEKTGQLDMGTTYDCFSPASNTKSDRVSREAQKNRQLLVGAMEEFGFYNYPKEWWHFTLKDEAFQEYFNFPVR